MAFDINNYKYEVKTLSYEDWERAFAPNKNHLVDNAPLHGMLYKHEAEEWKFIVGQYAQQLWTVLDEGGKLLMKNGLYVKGRLGYVFCDHMHNPREFFNVEVDPELLKEN